ncbi:MAG: hydroxyacid dehydrogenase, partial [Planctomycetaceae bacterium]
MTEIVPSATPDDPGEFLLSQSEDGQTRIDVRLSHETLWLSQRMIADLFPVSLKTANEHLVNIYAERELDPTAT